jgi:hypothetical protein
MIQRIYSPLFIAGSGAGISFSPSDCNTFISMVRVMLFNEIPCGERSKGSSVHSILMRGKKYKSISHPKKIDKGPMLSEIVIVVNTTNIQMNIL